MLKNNSVRDITDLTIPELRKLKTEIDEIILAKAKEEYKIGAQVKKNDELDDTIWIIVAVQVQFETPRLVLYPSNKVSSPTEIVAIDRVSFI